MAAIILKKGRIFRSVKATRLAAIELGRYYGDDAKIYNLSQLKRGTGGRSSFSGIVATVFGATGFVGRYVVNRLGKIGSQVIIPYRGEPYDYRYLKVAGDLGQILYSPFNLRDEESLEKAMKYSNVVINLIGRDYETKRFKFNDVHVKGAESIARVAKKLGIERLIHFSALNAGTNPPTVLRKPSGFYSSKEKGEEAVLNEFPCATIIRPADIYGQEDRFLRYYAGVWRRQFGAMPLWKKGEATIKQPVYVGDVAAAVIAAIRDPESAGQIYQAVGPKRYYLSDLVDWMYAVMRKTDQSRGYYRYDMRLDPLFRAKVTLTGAISPSWPVGGVHWERIERENTTDVVERGVPTLEDLGVAVTSLDAQGLWELRPFIWGLYHGLAADEPLPQPAPPKAVPA